MSATAGNQGGEASRELAGELHDLESQEAALERRTRSLEVSGPLALVLSVLALALSIGAFVVALSNDSGGMNRSTMPGAMGQSRVTNGTASGGMMAGGGAQGRFTSTMVAAGAKGTVYAQLGEYWVAPSVRTVRAGKVTFIATNVGKLPHELMVERMPIRFDSAMHPTEDAAQGMIEDMDAGATGRMTLQLHPGMYMLFCNVTGHYAAGQHTVLKVTST
jgi:uncharacterized cupredoxin-like copper-binding protein